MIDTTVPVPVPAETIAGAQRALPALPTLSALPNSLVLPKPLPLTATASGSRLGSLTGMRFFAALPVVLIHVGVGFIRGDWMNTAAGFGYIGVSFFFLLSGFVLTWSSSDQPARRFRWLRLARVWPAQLLMAVVAMTVLANQEQIPGTFGKVSELVLLQAWTPDQKVYYGGNGVSWSLSAEMFFYLMFPLVIIPLKRLRGRGLAVAAAVTLAVLGVTPLIASAAGMSGTLYSWYFFVFPPYRFGEFLLGMVLARAMMAGVRVPKPVWLSFAAAVGLTAEIWVMTVATMNGYAFQRPFVALMVLPFFAVLVASGATVDLREHKWWLNAWPMVRLGEWSFALYLVHKPTFLLTSRFHWWVAPGGLWTLLSFVEFLALAITVAAALHYLVEKPIANGLRRVPVGKRVPVTAAAQPAAAGAAA